MNFDFIAKPFGVLMQLIYNTIAFENYGLAIIIFSVFVRVLLFPLSLKQQVSMLKTQELSPQLEELKKLYGDNKEKLQEEQLKLYQKYNINPMAGCLPLLIQLPILITLYSIVTKPLTFISSVPANVVKELTNFVAKASNLKAGRVTEIIVNNYFFVNIDKLAEVTDKISSSQIINMNFLGIFNLGLSPSLGKLLEEPAVYIPLLFIPILAALTTYLTQKISTASTRKDSLKKNDNKTADVVNPLNTMTKIMPIVTLFFTFSVPAGVGLYWIMGNLLGIVQTYVTKLIVQKKKEGNE